MAATTPEASSRLTDWIPLDLKGKPIYAGVDETKRMDQMRSKINAVRNQWNNAEKCSNLVDDIHQAVDTNKFSRELQSLLKDVLSRHRYWADYQRTQTSSRNWSLARTQAISGSYASVLINGANSVLSQIIRLTQKIFNMFTWKIANTAFPNSEPSKDLLQAENYGALELYTTNDGYKKIFGYINQVFRKSEVNEIEIYGAVALVEILTIDLYNFRLANAGCSKYFNFQGIVHRGLSVNPGVLAAFKDLMKQPLANRNFSIPLAFVSTSIDQSRIQEFLDKVEPEKCRMHWKIHIHGLDQRLLGQYRALHPSSIVSTICAMPISRVSEYPNEQEILLRGAFFHILRIYEEKAGDHTVSIAEMVMLNANRDHGSELAENHGEKGQQRKHFGQMCAASRFEICASLAKEHGLPEAHEYKALANAMLDKLRVDHIDAPFNPTLSASWSVPRPSWIGASLSSSFPTFYAKRRERFSRASFKGDDWKSVQEVLDQEYDWQKSDWCNVPRLYNTAEESAQGSGFTVLHQAAFNNADFKFVQNLIDLGAWRTLKSSPREGSVTAQAIAAAKGYTKLAALLEPRIHHPIPNETLTKIQNHLHALMKDQAGIHITQHAIRLPQLSVLTEMNTSSPSLWIPIPSMYGGFILDLQLNPPSVTVTRIENSFPAVGESRYLVSREGVEDV